jgi:hypothetical protein
VTALDRLGSKLRRRPSDADGSASRPTDGEGPVGGAPEATDEPFGLRVVDVDAASASEHPDLLRRIAAREADAALVRGVLSSDEVDAAVARLNAVRSQSSREIFGHVLGFPLLRLGEDNADRSGYYEATKVARATYREAFGFDPHERVVSVLQHMTGGLPIEIPTEDGAEYNPGTVRWYLPGEGGLFPHVGNEFVDQNAGGALSHLLTVNQVREWMSWFMVLQRPDSGGTLTIYDLLHADRPPEIDQAGRDVREPLFAGRRSVTIDPAPGDLIVFCGGWRYHRVEQIGEGPPRMTYGGFMRADRTGTRIHTWS